MAGYENYVAKLVADQDAQLSAFRGAPVLLMGSSSSSSYEASSISSTTSPVASASASASAGIARRDGLGYMEGGRVGGGAAYPAVGIGYPASPVPRGGRSPPSSTRQPQGRLGAGVQRKGTGGRATGRAAGRAAGRATAKGRARSPTPATTTGANAELERVSAPLATEFERLRRSDVALRGALVASEAERTTVLAQLEAERRRSVRAEEGHRRSEMLSASLTVKGGGETGRDGETWGEGGGGERRGGMQPAW